MVSITFFFPLCIIHARYEWTGGIINYLLFGLIPRHCTRRPAGLQHEAQLGQSAHHPGGPGLSSVSGLRQHDGGVCARREEAAAAGRGRSGFDDEAALLGEWSQQAG